MPDHFNLFAAFGAKRFICAMGMHRRFRASQKAALAQVAPAVLDLAAQSAAR
jgi:hypothetical protein